MHLRDTLAYYGIDLAIKKHLRASEGFADQYSFTFLGFVLDTHTIYSDISLLIL